MSSGLLQLADPSADCGAVPSENGAGNPAEILCIRCAQHCETCCQKTDIYVTLQDVRRIEQHIGSGGFHEFRSPSDPVYAVQADDPLWMAKVFQPDGARRVLKQQPTGDCTFLGSAGCTLPADVRPLICRLYPFDYNAEGLKSIPASGCPQHLLFPGQSLFAGVGIDRQDAVRWHQMLYLELQQEP